MTRAQAYKIIDAHFLQRKNVILDLVTEAVRLLGITKVSQVPGRLRSRTDTGDQPYLEK